MVAVDKTSEIVVADEVMKWLQSSRRLTLVVPQCKYRNLYLTLISSVMFPRQKFRRNWVEWLKNPEWLLPGTTGWWQSIEAMMGTPSLFRHGPFLLTTPAEFTTHATEVSFALVWFSPRAQTANRLYGRPRLDPLADHPPIQKPNSREVCKEPYLVIIERLR